MQTGLLSGLPRTPITAPFSGLIVTSPGAAGNASGASKAIPWNRTGATAPLVLGDDVELSPADNTRIRILRDGVYSINCVVGTNANDGTNNGPVEALNLSLYLFGSQNALCSQVWTPYLGGMWQGAVASVTTTLNLQQGDVIRWLATAWTPSRVDSVTTSNGSPVITDITVQTGDLWKPVAGTGIPASSFVGTIISGTSFRLSSTKNAQADVNATASGTVLATLGGANWGLEGNVTQSTIYRVR